MADAGARIRYLRDCYRVDTRGGGIYDLLDKKLELCRFMTPEDRLLSSPLERQPMSGDEAAFVSRAHGPEESRDHGRIGGSAMPSSTVASCGS